MLFYVMYITGPLFERYVIVLNQLSPPSYYIPQEAALAGSPTHEPGLREDISGWGQPFYAVLFGGIMLYEVIIRRKCKQWEFDTIFMLWAVFGLVLYLFAGLFPVAKFGATYVGNRVPSFVYPFMLMAVAHFGFQLKPYLKQALFYLFMLGFLIINVAFWLFVPSDMIGSSFNSIDYGDNRQEWAMMDYLSSVRPEHIVTSHGVAHYFYYRYNSNPYQYIDVFENNLSPLKERVLFDYVTIRSQNPQFLIPFYRGFFVRKVLDDETLALISNTPWLEKDYDNQEWVIYRIIR